MARRLAFGFGWAAAAGIAVVFAWLLAATPSAQQGQRQAPAAAAQSDPGYLLHDSHLHLTNYIQEGPGIDDFLKVMGSKVGRVAIFGLPLQQMWDKGNTGDFAPTYYLQSDAPLYYYSFTDAFIAMQYRSLTPAEQARFDPMITGFNPADMYAADHIRRVLLTFPGVFSGIGHRPAAHRICLRSSSLRASHAFSVLHVPGTKTVSVCGRSRHRGSAGRVVGASAAAIGARHKTSPAATTPVATKYGE